MELVRPTAGAGAMPPVVTVKHGPCINCKHWMDLHCMIFKKPDEELECNFCEDFS